MKNIWIIFQIIHFKKIGFWKVGMCLYLKPDYEKGPYYIGQIYKRIDEEYMFKWNSQITDWKYLLAEMKFHRNNLNKMGSIILLNNCKDDEKYIIHVLKQNLPKLGRMTQRYVICPMTRIFRCNYTKNKKLQISAAVWSLITPLFE